MFNLPQTVTKCAINRKNIYICKKKLNTRQIISMLKRTYFLFLIIILIYPSALATTYYVSPSGNNMHTGSQNLPFKTIQFGISRLKAGDILIVRAGIYNETVYISGIDAT